MIYTTLSDISSIDRQAWTKLVNDHPHGTVFQSPEMCDFFSHVENCEPVVVAATDNEEKLAGILLGVTIREMKGPLGFFSARTVVYGGPLTWMNENGRLSMDEKDVSIMQDAESKIENTSYLITQSLLKALIRQVRGHSVFIQFRNFTDMTAYREVFEREGFRFRERLNYIVNLGGWHRRRSMDSFQPSASTINNRQLTTERLSAKSSPFSVLSRSRQRQVRKALESGATVGPVESLQEVRAFHDILRNLYRNKVKKPLPDWSFFEEFYKQSVKGRLGLILVVRYKGNVVGGILCPITPGRTIYEWYVCGLDQEHREAYPSVLATWGAMEYAALKGIPQFDFMGVGVPGRRYGVREFKARFGGHQVNYGRFARINNRFIYTISELGYNLLAMVKRI